MAELQAQVKQPQRLLADVKYYLNHKHPISDLLESGASNNQVIRWDSSSASWVVGYAPSYGIGTLEDNKITTINNVNNLPTIATISKFSYNSATNTISWAVTPPPSPDSEWLIQGTQDNMHTLKLKPSPNPANNKYVFAVTDTNDNIYVYINRLGYFFCNLAYISYLRSLGSWISIGSLYPLFAHMTEGTFMKLKTSIPDFSSFPGGWYLPLLTFYHDGVDNTKVYVAMRGTDDVVRTGYITVT